MAIVTTYVCDVSGKQGERKDFVEVKIHAQSFGDASYITGRVTLEKIIHKDVAEKLHLVFMNKQTKEDTPEPTLESKLTTLLREYVAELAYEAGTEAAIDAVRNR